MYNIILNNIPVLTINDSITLKEIHSNIHSYLNLDVRHYYLLRNGKLINTDTLLGIGNIEIILRTCGGKGGFGSMLRAIGAQIEKTTNREACRDLSGRRLRDINEEKRLKKWITQQAEREQEAAKRKQRKLEKLCETPKYKFEDKDYDNERSQLLELVENAVSQGMKATCSHNDLKRKNNSEPTQTKKKQKLWIDAEVEDLSSNSSDESIDENNLRSLSGDSQSNSADDIENSSLLNKKQDLTKPSGEIVGSICSGNVLINNSSEEKEGLLKPKDTSECEINEQNQNKYK